MKPGLFTWNELEPIHGKVLVVVNSVAGDTAPVEALLATIDSHLPAAILHVIATTAWQGWLDRRGIAADRVLIATDDEGRDVELNHFLESPAAVLWTVANQFSCITGTEAHSVYNEEVKDIFERRVLVLLGEGRFLAHTLPNPYVYALDLARLLERCGRDLKTCIGCGWRAGVRPSPTGLTTPTCSGYSRSAWALRCWPSTRWARSRSRMTASPTRSPKWSRTCETCSANTTAVLK
jgi:hypothetical protein